jgi:hypothetical protein
MLVDIAYVVKRDAGRVEQSPHAVRLVLHSVLTLNYPVLRARPRRSGTVLMEVFILPNDRPTGSGQQHSCRGRELRF